MKARRPARFFVPATLALSIVTGIHMIAHAADDGGVTSQEDAGPDATADGAVPRNPSTATCGGGGPHADEMTLFGAGCC